MPQELSQEEFLEGVTEPRNKELIRVFKDVDLIENIGSGVLRILDAYDKSCFKFMDHFLRFSFKYKENPFEYDSKNKVSTDDTLNGTIKLTKNEQQILNLIINNNQITREEIVNETNLSDRTISRAIKHLQEVKIIEREGSKKTGSWKILKVIYKGRTIIMVNLELYRIFKVVAEEENLTKASEILHISQPAVTKHIKNLENELHVQLFKRSKYGMILNENGKKLYSQIKDAIDVILKAEAIFNMHSNINLGVHVNMPSKIYNSAILKFYDDYQNSIINIHQLTAENMFSMLEKQKIDLAFSKKYSDEIYNSKEIKFIKIGELHDVFIVNANSQYLNKKLSKKDLRNTTIYTLKKFSSAYQNLIKELEYSESDTINVDNVNYTAMLELLKVRDIITVITKEYVEEKIADNELCVLDVGFSLPNAEFGLYYNVNNKFKELNDLIEILKNNCKV